MVDEKAPVPVGARGLDFTNIDQAFRAAEAIHQSGLAPKSLNSPQKVLVAMLTGMDAGLGPLQSLRAVVVIGGLPSWKGESALGLIRDAGHKVEVGTRGEGDAREGFFQFEHLNGQTGEVTFTVKEAKNANLWGKGNWATYPDDMLVWRAVARGGRRYFSNHLMGLRLAEEQQDISPPEDPRPAQVVTAQPEPLLVASQSDPTVEPEEIILPAEEPTGGATEPQEEELPDFPWDAPPDHVREEWVDKANELAADRSLSPKDLERLAEKPLVECDTKELEALCAKLEEM